jgi:Death domain
MFIILKPAEKRRKRQNGDQPAPPSTSSNPFGEKRNEIFKVIAKEISSSEFSTLSRYLKFPDNEVKEIELKHRAFSTRTMVLLNHYEAKMTSMKPLISALTIMKRLDIVKKIESF